jgi:hypothetical protein
VQDGAFPIAEHAASMDQQIVDAVMDRHPAQRENADAGA